MKKNIQALTTLAIIWIWCQKHYFDIHSSSFDTCPIVWLRLWNFIMNQVELNSVLHSNKPLKRIFWYLIAQLWSDIYELGTLLHNNFFWKSTKLKRLLKQLFFCTEGIEMQWTVEFHLTHFEIPQLSTCYVHILLSSLFQLFNLGHSNQKNAFNFCFFNNFWRH